MSQEVEVEKGHSLLSSCNGALERLQSWSYEGGLFVLILGH